MILSHTTAIWDNSMRRHLGCHSIVAIVIVAYRPSIAVAAFTSTNLSRLHQEKLKAAVARLG